MLWKILLELLFVLVALFAGAPFWACLKAPRHLHSMLSDPVELKSLIDHVGYDKLRAEAQQVQAPSFGTFGDNIAIWETALHKSLSRTRNGLFLGVLVALAASWWLGAWYFTVSLAVFFMLGFTELPDSAKNNNANHIVTVTLNLIKWLSSAPATCEQFCLRERPQYSTLHDVLVVLDQRSKA